MRFGLRVVCAIGMGLMAAVRFAAASPASPQQQIALIAKPAVVRVQGAYVATYELDGHRLQESIGGSGTGFFITADGYIATNAHVVAAIQGGDVEAKEALKRALWTDIMRQAGSQLAQMTPAQITQLRNAIRLVELKKLAYVVLPNGDHLDYQIKEFGTPGQGRDCAIIKVNTSNAPTLPIGDSTRSQVEDRIVVLGYPGVADFESLLDEKSQLQATVTDGTISSLKRAASGEPILQISAPITHGNSGGPAIDQHGNVIGLATFGNQGEIQGFNFLVASATLMDLVKQAKLDPRPSPTTETWRAGLEHYWADEYTEAIAKFEEVETAFPAHSEAQDFIRLSHQAQKDGKEKHRSSSAGIFAGLAIGGLVMIGGAVLVMRRGRKQPGAPAGQPPGYTGPPPPGYAPTQAGHVPRQPGFAPPQPGFAPPQPGFTPPQQGYAPTQPGYPPQPGTQQAGYAPTQQAQPLPMYGRVTPPSGAPPQQQMYGRVMPPGQPPGQRPGQPSMQPSMQSAMQPTAETAIPKTVAIHGGIAPTAFGTLSIGSLTCTRGELAGERFSLTATGIIVGRQPGVAHILVNDHRASGKHVWIGIENGVLVAIDQSTTNGTYINDVARGRITRSPLRDGDVIIIGEPDCLSLQVKLG